MQRLIIAAFTALCIIGTSSLVMANEATKGETDTTMKSEVKGKKKAHKEKTKAKHSAAKGKMKAAAPSTPAPEAAPAPAMGQ